MNIQLSCHATVHLQRKSFLFVRLSDVLVRFFAKCFPYLVIRDGIWQIFRQVFKAGFALMMD
jgi:hypothetical protein